jgi:hypothetical protein
MRPALAASLAALALLAPFEAHALLKVTNLSGSPKTIIFRTAGSEVTKTIAHNESQYFPGSEGMLSLAGTSQKGETLGASGMLSGIIGAVRTVDIPASQMDEFVVWPDGRLLVQKRNKAIGIRK